jgi:hypothetical protein
VRRARKSIASFKLREGMAVGARVTTARRADVRVPRPADLDRAARASATSAASIPDSFDGAGTTRSASASRSSSPRSTTTPSRDPGPRRRDHHHGGDDEQARRSCARSACRSPPREGT